MIIVREGRIREDGRTLHPVYLFEAKKPSESKSPWDYYKLKATIPAAEAFQPLSRIRMPAGEEVADQTHLIDPHARRTLAGRFRFRGR